MRRLLALLLIINCQLLIAQDLGALEQSIKEAREQLAQIEKLTGENTRQTTSSQRSLSMTRNKIGAQRKVVQGLDAQASTLSRKITTGERQVERLEGQLERLKKEYGASVVESWKNYRLNTATAFLLASRDFNDGVRRLSFLRRYNNVRASKGAQIDSLAKDIEAEIVRLETDRTKLKGVQAECKKELGVLTEQETGYAETLKTLQSDRKKLAADEKSARDKIAAAQREIDRIMAEQARAAGREVDLVLSGLFEENKGLLPWPVGGRGTVLDHFGVVRGADGISRDSKGITIATEGGAQIKAVFEGVVTGVYNIGQFDKCVTVRSGNYVVLYGNLADTRLKNGDKVALGDRVGRVNSSADASRHLLLFQIWHETTPLNPEQWLR